MNQTRVFSTVTNRRKGKKGKGSKGKRRANQLQAISSGAIARPFPATFRVRQTYSNGETFTSSTKVIRGLSEFLAKPPMYYNYMYGIYKYCRVLAVELEVLWNSTGTDSMRVAIGRVPYSDISGITYSQFSEMPETQIALLSAKGGMDKVTQIRTFVARNAIGQALTDHSYWVNSAQAISTTPLHTDDYALLIMSDGVTLGSAASATVRVHYHLEWFDLQYAV